VDVASLRLFYIIVLKVSIPESGCMDMDNNRKKFL